MSRYHSYLTSSERILRSYNGEVPLAIYLKQFFSEHRQMGGRDRKMISQLCYQYFRLGHFGKDLPVFEKVVLAAQLHAGANHDFLQAVVPDAVDKEDRVEALLQNKYWQQVFSFSELLSTHIDKAAFSQSILHQPHLFLRIRPGCNKQVLTLFDEQNIPYKLIGTHCLQVPNGTPVNTLAQLDKWLVVQDRSSQQTGELILKANLFPVNDTFSIWDCCAASGGKSIMLADLYEHIQLTVSDIRDSILQNLKQRFRIAGVHFVNAFVADISRKQQDVPNAPFDMILADVPCTGSGTWSRTPEQLYFFRQETLKTFTDRQYAIASNSLRWLKEKGYLIYITCSVFASENEEVISALVEKNGLKIMLQEYIKGYDVAADSMFISILQKP